MNEVIVPDKILNAHERTMVATHAVQTLLETRSAVESYVIIAQMQSIIDETKELLKEKALLGMQGREMEVNGAKVSSRRKVEYEYEAPTLARLDAQKKEIDGRLKSIKKAVEATGVWIDPETGEENKANKTAEGMTIAVTLPK